MFHFLLIGKTVISNVRENTSQIDDVDLNVVNTEIILKTDDCDTLQKIRMSIIML